MAIEQINQKIGNWKDYKVWIDGKEVQRLITTLEIFMDIFYPVWTGKCIIIDSVNIQEKIKLHVGSKIKIYIETHDPKPCGTFSKTYDFVIQKIHDKISVKKDQYAYPIDFIDEKGLNDIKTRTSKAYINKTPVEIVTGILKETGQGTLDKVDNDPTRYDIITPNWAPLTACTWVTKFAKVPDGDIGADYVFWQSEQGGVYNFRSIEKMFNDFSNHTFIIAEANWRLNKNKENDDAWIKIKKYQFITQLDGYRNLVHGFFGNTTIEHDLIHKKINKNTYTYSQDNSKDLKNKPFKGNSFDGVDGCLIYIPKNRAEYNSTPQNQNINETHKKWLGSRKSHQLKHETNRLIIELAGSACLYKDLGKYVIIKMPKQNSEDPTKEDSYYTGKWLVASIKHTFSAREYHIQFELTKKRLNTSI